MRGKLDASRRAAATALIRQCGWSPKSVAVLLDITPASARAYGQLREPPKVADREQLWRLLYGLVVEAKWTRLQIGTYLGLTEGQIDRALYKSGKPKPGVRRRKKPTAPAVAPAPPEAGSADVEGPEVPNGAPEAAGGEQGGR